MWLVELTRWKAGAVSVPFAHRRLPNGSVEFDLLGRWSAEAADAFMNSAAESLVLNYARGFEADDLSFLTGLAVRRLTILDYKPYDLTPIYSLGDTLVSLSLGRQMAAIDLTELPYLTDLRCDWTNVASSIANVDGLGSISLGGYRPRDLTPLSHLHLESLRLLDRPRLKTLSGLETHVDLEKFEVAGSSLSDLTPASALASLQDLRVPGCVKLDNLDAVTGLVALLALDVSECNNIDSFSPLRGTQALEHLHAHGSTKVIDGDLKPLLELPQLRDVRMMNRRNYKPSVSDVQAQLAGGLTG
jgi:hypothetical protein